MSARTSTSKLPVLPRLGPRQNKTGQLEPEVSDVDLSGETANLSADDAWRDFARSFVGSRTDNVAPWFRCLGLLRGLGAKWVVIEHNYVCLDHRSEYANFYAHGDQPRNPAAVRLHFFDQKIPRDRLPFLTPDQSESYLGYVVCRRGDLPIVGRAMITWPTSYIDECAEVEELVNFLGQKLKVRGVPFTQQDEKFAVCAHSAAWAISYAMYRRGLGGRRLISDIVKASSGSAVAGPAVSFGVMSDRVQELFGNLGLGVETYWIPSLSDAYTSSFPRVVSSILSAEDREAFGDLLSSEKDLLEVLENLVRDIRLDSSGSETEQENRRDQVSHLVCLIVDLFVQPMIRSRMPIFAGTVDHAMVLVGRKKTPAGVFYFVHDDQNGPYLAIDGMHRVSRSTLAEQSGDEREPDGSTPNDKILAFGPERFSEKDEAFQDRSIQFLSLIRPVSVHLSPLTALDEARVWQEEFSAAMDQIDSWSSGADADVRPRVRVVSSLVMGIDFKNQRRSAVASTSASDSKLYASLHLSEWVYLMEGVDEAGCIWELVFDASTGGAPRLQYARAGRVALVPPLNVSISGSEPASLLLEVDRLPRMHVPSRVGKVASDAAAP